MYVYMLTYYGGEMPECEKRCEEYKLKWENWEEGVGDALIDAGAPLGTPKTVRAAGVTDGTEISLRGFSIVEAKDIDTAVELTKGNPYLTELDGAIEVAELLEMRCCD